MSHVIIKAPCAGGLLFVCECGRVLGMLHKPYNEQAYEDIGLAHREHVRMALDIPSSFRLGNNPHPAVRAMERRMELMDHAPTPLDLERIKDELYGFRKSDDAQSLE